MLTSYEFHRICVCNYDVKQNGKGLEANKKSSEAHNNWAAAQRLRNTGFEVVFCLKTETGTMDPHSLTSHALVLLGVSPTSSLSVGHHYNLPNSKTILTLVAEFDIQKCTKFVLGPLTQKGQDFDVEHIEQDFPNFCFSYIYHFITTIFTRCYTNL